MKEKLSEKVIWNAISAYLMIFISGLFLFNKTNKNIDNDFVKWHTKSAMLIHLWFLITYIVFISNSLFSGISFMWFWLNNIITDIIFISLLWLLILWIYKAKNGLEFSISKNINISKKEAILDIDWDWEITEKEKFTILLSFVPFIGFINFAKYREHKTIIEATRLNIITSLIITLLYIFSYWNLANLLTLAYIILITFIWINLFTRNELLQIKLPKAFSPENSYLWLISSIEYLKNYFKDWDFKEFNTLIKANSEKLNKQELADETLLKTKKDLKLPKFLIYIPFINLIFLFFKNTKYNFHIINGIIITLIITWLIWLSYITNINYNFFLLILFPTLFWIWYTKDRLAYRMPIIFDIYILFSKIFSFLKFWTKQIKEKRNEVNEVKLKVK
jgi:hypothetical protein